MVLSLMHLCCVPVLCPPRFPSRSPSPHTQPPTTDVGGAGRLGPTEWLDYYTLLAALGRGFLGQDAHGNGQLDE